MPRLRASSEQLAPVVWQRFQSLINPQLLAAPRLHWEQIDRRTMNYIIEHTVDTPWMNHVAFFAAIETCYLHLDPKSVHARICVFHLRWQTIFQTYGLTRFSEWDPAEYLARYQNDADLQDSFEKRQEFVRLYSGVTRNIQIYLNSLPKQEQTLYQPWMIPPLPVGMREQLYQGQDLKEAQAKRRKAESDALVPHFARIRSEAHLRWNEIHRLRQKFQEVIGQVQQGQMTLPVSFSYEEPRRKQHLHFVLWDRPSFVIGHADRYHRNVVYQARGKRGPFAPERNHFFLEFSGAANISESQGSLDLDALLWFGDLIRHGVCGQTTRTNDKEKFQKAQAFLRSWGYGEEGKTGVLEPFSPGHPGLLAGNHNDGTGDFMRAAQQRSDSLLILVEPFFAAATFGLVALDFFTTTGARVGELLQISLTPDCLYTMEIDGTQRLLVKLVPKGRDEVADYMVGPETVRIFERVAQMLKEHYRIQVRGALPHVTFHPDNNRAHQFPEPRPYLFQYKNAHLSRQAITACMRFLLHGLVFQTTEGKVVVFKPHLLRHVFATHLHHAEQVPLDVVATILHQRDVRVTGYYAAPPWQQVVETADHLLNSFATQLGNVDDAFVRAPAELQRQWEDAKQSVGALARVIGGDCCCYAVCPISFACTGCAYKIPDPARREEIVQQRQWALIRLEQVKRQGLRPEAAKMQVLLQHCDTELEEMDLIEEYQRDETYAPTVTIEPEC